MTDELRYERLAVSVARTGSLVPRIHGVDIHSYSQLYPLLIAPTFLRGYVPGDLTDAHILNAVVMSSAAVPAFLLARRVTERSWAPWLVGLTAVCMPWILYAAMLMTEVAAYPAFMWAMFASQRAIAAPSARRDLAALCLIGVAYFARAELIVLVLVLPVAVLVYEIGSQRGRTVSMRIRGGVARAVKIHPALTAAYLVLCVGAIALELKGSLGNVVGIYGLYAQNGTLIPRGLAGAIAEHLATFSLGLGVLPVLVGGAWLLANLAKPHADPARRAFACFGAVAAIALLVQAADFDVRYTGYVHDRFLLYLVPVFVLAMLCAVEDSRRPRWSLLIPTAVVAIGFATGALPSFTWARFQPLLPDTPISALYHPIVQLSHTLTNARIALAGITIALALLFLQWSALLRTSRLAIPVACFTLCALAGTTTYTFVRFFDTNGQSGRPITKSEAGVNDFIDERVGTDASVTMIPYPVSSNYFVSQGFWRDLEFWNKSVERDAHYPGPGFFESTGIWFPKTYLSFDERSGAAKAAPTRYVVQGSAETRFRISGTAIANQQGVLLIHALIPWRLDWLTFGLYDDGWTRPGTTVSVRVFSALGEKHAVIRQLTVAIVAPPNVTARPVRLSSDEGSLQATASSSTQLVKTIRVCVPKHGFATVRLAVHGASTIPGDLASEPASLVPRQGGVLINWIALADEIGGLCST